MTNPKYDPAKAHDYYERTKRLKGRQPGSAEETLKRVGTTTVAVTRKPINANGAKSRAQARVVRLTTKLHSLQNALKEAEDALQNLRKEAKKNSDGKTTTKEKLAAKKYRDTHKSEIKTKAKKVAAKTSGSTSPSAPKSVSEMSESELTDRVSKIKTAVSNAKQQIQKANSIAHSFSSLEFISHSGPLTVNTN